MFTPGWIGQSNTFDMQYLCTEAGPGGQLAGKVPAMVSYIIAFTARRNACLSDCNSTNAVGYNGCTTANSSDLCTKGAAYIRSNFTSVILPLYKTYAQGFAQYCGTKMPLIWEMEPDYFQYYDAAQGGDPLTVAEAASYMTQMVQAVKQYLPNAYFSMDISPWMPNNGAEWYPSFDMSLFTFINTSGGSTNANSTLIRTTNAMTWAGVHQVTGKPILADTGYGASGVSAGPDPNWDDPTNINARIADGVISITQYNPTASTWGGTIAANRPHLNAVACY
jgi:hypothetical protein